MKVGNNTDFEVIEPGTYPAQLVQWDDKDQFGNPLMSMAFADREPSEQWKFKFYVQVEEYAEPRHLSAWVNKPPDPDNISTKAKIYELAKAILGDEADTTDWDVPDLVEGRLRVQVEVYDKKDGSEANKISKFYPPPKKRVAQAEQSMREAVDRAGKVQVPANRAAAPVEEEEEVEEAPQTRRNVVTGGKLPF
jgi:hypothetical protein